MPQSDSACIVATTGFEQARVGKLNDEEAASVTSGRYERLGHCLVFSGFFPFVSWLCQRVFTFLQLRIIYILKDL